MKRSINWFKKADVGFILCSPACVDRRLRCSKRPTFGLYPV